MAHTSRVRGVIVKHEKFPPLVQKLYPCHAAADAAASAIFLVATIFSVCMLSRNDVGVG